MSKLSTPVFHTVYNPPGSATVTFSLDSMTDQSYKDESDINFLVESYLRTGTLGNPANFSKVQPKFDDFTDVPDFQEMHEIISHGTDLFMTLSAKERASFKNDPATFYLWLADPVNTNEAVSRGYINVPTDEAYGEDTPDEAHTAEPLSEESKKTPSK